MADSVAVNVQNVLRNKIRVYYAAILAILKIEQSEGSSIPRCIALECHNIDASFTGKNSGLALFSRCFPTWTN